MITKAEAEKAYADLIQLRRSEVLVKDKANPGQIEFHHVLPRCCGGSDDQSNIVALYAKEHFMAHVYLWAIHHDDEYYVQMLNALIMMQAGIKGGIRKNIQDYILQSDAYQLAKCEFSKLQSSRMKTEFNSMRQKHWYYNPLTLETYPFSEGCQPIFWLLGKHPQKTVRISLWQYIRKVEPEITRLNYTKQFDATIHGKADNKQVRRFLVATFGLHCFKCGETTKKIYIHNIDGNLQNLQISNYELLCKDCYFKSGNIGWQLKKQK